MMSLHTKLRALRRRLHELTTYQVAVVLGHGDRSLRRWIAEPPQHELHRVAQHQLAALVSIEDRPDDDTVVVTYQRSRLPTLASIR